MTNKIINTDSDNILSYLENIYFNKMYLLSNNLYNILLDSSLISKSNRKLTNIRLVKCGDYVQFYFLPYQTYTTDKSLEKVNKLIISVTSNYLHNDKPKLKQIELKNITRSKINLQNLIKCNEKDFKTFFTLTFEENLTDVKEANKKFNVWCRNFRRLFPNFKYVCVPEFQKRGAVHYHLMTNVPYTDTKVLLEERRIYNNKSGWQIGKDVKGWIYGYSMAKDMDNVNLVGYITKYMTKDIDDRLFSQHRYFYSQNLNKPQEYNFDLTSFQDKSHWLLLDYSLKEMTYYKVYQNNWKENILFLELVIYSNIV